jgi:hypothetical protein
MLQQYRQNMNLQGLRAFLYFITPAIARKLLRAKACLQGESAARLNTLRAFSTQQAHLGTKRLPHDEL